MLCAMAESNKNEEKIKKITEKISRVVKDSVVSILNETMGLTPG